MVDSNKINEIASRIATRFNPDKIILFGSYAAGNPNKDSDLDILYLLDLLAQRIEIDEDIYDKAI